MAGYAAALSAISIYSTVTLDVVLLLAILLLVEPRQTLFDEVVRMPRARVHAMSVGLLQRPAKIICSYRSSGGVRVALVSVEGRRVIAESDFGTSGEVAYQTNEPGQYEVILEKDPESSMLGDANLKVDLAYNDFASFEPRTLSTQRRIAVIAAGLALFLCVSFWSGRRLARAVQNRQ